MKYIGLSVIIIGAFKLCGAYLSKRKRNLTLCEELLRLFWHIEKEVGSRMRSLREAVLSFESDILPRTKEKTVTFGKAEMRKLLDGIKGDVPCGAYDVAFGFFFERSEEQIEGERKRICMAREKIKKIADTEREKYEKARATVPIVTVAISLGIAILLI